MIRICWRVSVALVVTVVTAEAANLSADQAREKAIAILQGDPYGQTPSEVARNVRAIEYLPNGSAAACGRRDALWQFHVVVDTGQKGQFRNGVIDGYLWLDARSGKMLCASLPMLD